MSHIEQIGCPVWQSSQTCDDLADRESPAAAMTGELAPIRMCGS